MEKNLIPLEEIQKADHRIRSLSGLVLQTPLLFSTTFSERTGAEVWFKCEHLQRTGSFKLRGAANKILCLSPESAAKGVVTASTGNHGMGVALSARQRQVSVTVFVPENASETKLDVIRQLSAEIIKVPGDALAAELAASRHARETSRTFISPYNDPDIIAGQGTVGLEIIGKEDGIDTVFVSVGGGGLISGIGSCFRQKKLKTKIAGCWPKNAPSMYECLKAGKIQEVEEKFTISDGTAGGVEPGAVTFPICREVIDEKIKVSEDEIKAAMKLMAEHEHFMIEGAAGVALASFLKTKRNYQNKKVVVVLCGRNIMLEKFIQAVS